MQFCSIQYLLFLVPVCLVFRLTPAAYRYLVLVAASLLFVALLSLPALLVLLLFSGLTYGSGMLLDRSAKYRSVLYLASLFLQLSCLILLKYVESGQQGLRFFPHDIGFQMHVLLFAIGFSFYTLQHIAYLTEVYFRRMPACHQPLRFLLFSAFFAKINAGPLAKAKEFLPQTHIPLASSDDLRLGVERIALGFFKKMVLADRLAPIVSQLFDPAVHAGSAATAAGICLFTIQLYLDFSAYTDIAIGTAYLFGIRLPENFNFPFRATSVSEFWRRWHMSLITWFSQYIYYPLVFKGRRLGQIAVFAGIALTFLASGIWHGIGKTFFCWSVLHMLYLSFERLGSKKRRAWAERNPSNLYRLAGLVITFLLVCFSNLFFRSANMPEARHLLTQLSGPAFALGLGWGWVSGSDFQLPGNDLPGAGIYVFGEAGA
jgi:alginate O-acetyltransferase complex protein AlgI